MDIIVAYVKKKSKKKFSVKIFFDKEDENVIGLHISSFLVSNHAIII